MIVVLAHESDPWAPELARQVADLSGGPAAVCTPRDLSRPGWVLGDAAAPASDTSTPGLGRSFETPDAPRGAPQDNGITPTIVVSGEVVSEGDVELVVSLIDDVVPQELLWIREEDTDYVACEMSAVLRYWLESLGPRAMVAPGATSLAGPDHPTSVWAGVAGLRTAAGGSTPIDWRDHREVDVVDGEASGDASPVLRRAATAMAEWARVPWLRAFFSPGGDELWGVTTLPAPRDDVVAQARAILRAARSKP